jgi:2-amino-4-hydroxy-6-hydroxymethyldihydropteridine diphosphokinase
LHDLEREAGRVRDGRLNAPRVLDLDLISYGDVVMRGEEGLILPHPRAAERAFVMGPLAEIAPDWIHPDLQRTATELLTAATIGIDAYPLSA